MGVMETPQKAHVSDNLARFVERPPEVEAVQCPVGSLAETIVEWQRLAALARGQVVVPSADDPRPVPRLLLKPTGGEPVGVTAWAGDWLVWRLDAARPRPFGPPDVWPDEAFRARFEESVFERNRRAFEAELDELPPPPPGSPFWEDAGRPVVPLPELIAVVLSQCGRPEAGDVLRRLGFAPGADLSGRSGEVLAALRDRGVLS